MKKKTTTPPLPPILMISSERYPHHDTNTQQVIKNATAMHAVGVPVELLIPVQKKSFWNPSYDTAQAIYTYYNVPPALPIRELRNVVPAGDWRLEKFFHSFGAVLYAFFFRKKAIVYTRNKFAAILCILLGKKFIFETYRRLGDDYPRAMRWFARRAQKDSFVGMVLHSHVSKGSMLRAGLPAEKLLVLHNGFDRADMEPRLSKPEARRKLGLDAAKSYVVYTGNMQKNKCIESLIDIAAHTPEIWFLLVGGRAEDLERLQSYAAAKGVKNVSFPGRQPIGVVSEYLYAADALIIPPVSAPLEKFGRTVLPFKIFPYLAAGRAIIAPDLPDMRELLIHRQNALLVEPDNPKQNARALRELFANPDLMDTLAQNARKTSEGLTWEARGKKFKAWYESRMSAR